MPGKHNQQNPLLSGVLEKKGRLMKADTKAAELLRTFIRPAVCEITKKARRWETREEYNVYMREYMRKRRAR